MGVGDSDWSSYICESPTPDVMIIGRLKVIIPLLKVGVLTIKSQDKHQQANILNYESKHQTIFKWDRSNLSIPTIT